MAHEGQVIDPPRTTRWAARWRVESVDPDRDAERLLAEAKREGLTLSVGKVAPVIETFDCPRQINGGPWEPVQIPVIRRTGRLIVGCISYRTTSRFLERQHSIFKTWLTPRTNVSDTTEADWAKLEVVWRRVGLAEPTYLGRDPLTET